MLNEGLILKPRADVRFRVIGDEGVVVLQEEAEVIALNEVGASIFSLLDARRSLGEVLEALLDEYDVDRESLASDLSTFVSELRDVGIVEEA
jgi:hypothetical protein